MTHVKALFILPNLGPGGAERMTLRLLGDLTARGLDLTLFLFSHEGLFLSEVPADVKVVGALESYRQVGRNSPFILRRLLKSARNTDVIVGALELEPIYFAYLCGRMLNKPVIGWVRTSMSKHLRLLSRWHTTLTKVIYPRLESVVLLSQGAATSLEAVVNLRPERVAIIPSYLDWQLLQAKAAEEIPPLVARILAKPTIVTVGRLVTAKGLDVLIRAHARIQASGPNHNLLILGEGPLRTELEALTCSLDVQDSVFMPGFVSNPYPIMRAVTIFVLASRYEGFPLVLLEALGVGAAVLATDCSGGSKEILDNGKYGLLVTPEDEGALAHAISRLLTDSSLRNKLRSAGPVWARSFSREDSVSRWERLLSDVGGGSSQH
jgi:glycosyltransferase involved in cell wall biosynthesis